jgi:hypothetical protein
LLDVLVAATKLGQTDADAFGGAPRRLLLAGDGGTRVERLDLAQLLEQRSFERQHGAANQAYRRRGVSHAPCRPGRIYAATAGARWASEAA